MMATSEIRATWMRLRDGSWGLRGPASMTEGSLVTVTRRDGSSSQERVAKVLWRGESEAYASVVPQAQSASRRDRRGRLPLGPRHGSAAPVAGYSGYCTDNEDCGCFDCAS